MAARSHLFAALRHPHEPKLLLLRSDREWRLPHVLVKDAVWGTNAKVIVPAFERRLGTRLWLLGQINEASIFELELLDPGWEAPAHGRWIGRNGLRALRLEDEEHRPILAVARTVRRAVRLCRATRDPPGVSAAVRRPAATDL